MAHRYGSIYRADDQILVNQYAYGASAAHTHVVTVRGTREGEITCAELEAYEAAWAGTSELR